MTIEEIRKNKPDGATHYDDYGDFYLLDAGFLIWSSIKKDYVAYCTYIEGIGIGFKPL